MSCLWKQMSLIAQLGWVQIGDLEVKGCGFCYQSSKLPIPQAESTGSDKRGENYLTQFINTLHESVGK